jgi:hypothetical protein
MRRPMHRSPFAAAAALLVLAACGNDLTGIVGDTCSTTTAELSRVATCTVRPNANVVLEVQPSCQLCGQSSPSCGSEYVNGAIELTPIYRACQNDTSCPTQRCGTKFVCNVATPPASGTVQVTYPTANNGLGSATLTLSPSGDTSCSL